MHRRHVPVDAGASPSLIKTRVKSPNSGFDEAMWILNISIIYSLENTSM